MPNVLKKDKQVAVVAGLAEGMAIRQLERVTGIHRDTIMRLGVRVGKGCARLMDEKMGDLNCTNIQVDELWGFVSKKQRNVTPEDKGQKGDVWTWCALDADTKLVPSYKVGRRDVATAHAFMNDLAGRLENRVQLSSDGLWQYVEAVEESFGADVDYGRIVKTYAVVETKAPQRRYSPPELVSVHKDVVTGDPVDELISTSYVERLNLTTRHHMKRLARLTLAFSKKLENFEAAVGLHFAYYNFVKNHKTLRCTPAMAAGVERDFWTVADLVEKATQ